MAKMDKVEFLSPVETTKITTTDASVTSTFKGTVEIKEALEKNEKLSARIEELNAKSTELRKQTDNTKNEISALTVKRDFCEKQSGELRQQEREKTEEKEKISAELVRLEEKKNTLIREQEETETKLYDEYKLTKREAMEHMP